MAQKDPKIEGLEEIIKAISKPSSRRKFKKDPEAVLKALKAEDFPKDVLALFAEMSPAELRLIAQLNTTLCENEFTSERSGTVCIV